jgi:hypothetical protein
VKARAAPKARRQDRCGSVPPAMSPICPRDGHYEGEPQGSYCADHGVPWFEDCSSCGAEWPFIDSAYSDSSGQGRDFCSGCGMPGPWLTRPQLMEWIRSNLQASVDVPASTRLELLEVLSKLEAMDANDTKGIAGWQRIREAAPKVWERTKPVRDALISEAVKKAMGS